MSKQENKSYVVLPKDRWRSATAGFIQEIVSADVVVFTGLIDTNALAQVRADCAQSGFAKPSWTSIVVKAISVALRKHSRMNRLLLGGIFRHRPIQLSDVHAVVAVERVRGDEDTVYAQILRHTDEKPIWELSEELRKASEIDEPDDARLELFMKIVRNLPGPLARWILSGPRWFPSLWQKHRGGSFALTTVGKYGVDSVFVKWPWPLSFTFGEVKERPMVVDGVVKPRLSFYLSLAWNRELTNGAPAARFFNDIVQYLAQGTVSDEERIAISRTEQAT